MRAFVRDFIAWLGRIRSGQTNYNDSRIALFMFVAVMWFLMWLVL